MNSLQKRVLLQAQGQTVIYVPFWWDGKIPSLLASLWHQRPDLVAQTSRLLANSRRAMAPIALNAPHESLDGYAIPHVGELMLASFPPETFKLKDSISTINPWWMGEKYDGVRFCWQAALELPFSRTGLQLEIPLKILNSFTTTFLDGEIWFGRGCFTEAQKVIHEQTGVNWPFFRGVVFDEPDPELRKLPFEDRYKKMLLQMPTPAARVLCVDPQLLVSATQSLIAAGGEGVVLRKPDSQYLQGRSDVLFKFKASTADTEALVVSLKNGSPLLKLPNGVLFRVNRQSVKVNLHPGEVVTFSYLRQARQAVPTNPTVYRVRKDLSWEEVLDSHRSDHEADFASPSRKALGFLPKPMGYWSSENRQNIRSFLEKFAKDNNFDPLVAENWYAVSSSHVSKQEGAAMLAYYNGSLVRALLDLFPNIGLEKSRFAFLPKRYWNSAENRRKFFIEISSSLGIDPLNPKSWYKSYDELLKTVGNHYVLNFYKGSYITALIHLFPEIGLQRNKFPLPQEFWRDSSHRRLFFTRFASAKQFDPLMANNWYHIKLDDIKATKHGLTVLSYYGGSLKEALVALFPEVVLKKELFFKLNEKPSSKWTTYDTGKLFLLRFAASKGFDPFNPENWYKVRKEDVESFEEGRTFLGYHRRSHIQALFTLFPDIGLQRAKFSKLPRNYWKEVSNRREFFFRFAASRGLDPTSAEQWSHIKYQDIYDTKEGKSVLAYHGGSYARALTEAIPELRSVE